MSKYTTEVRFLCESLTGHQDSVGYDDVDAVIQEAIPIIFSFDFPIFDEEYRNVLETKILRHYYTREIGLETYGLWKLKLETKLNEIMPYYNKLYLTELWKYDPLRDVDLTTTHVGKRTGETNTSHEGSEKGVNTDNRINNFSGTRESENEQTNVGSTNSQGGSTSTNMDLYSDTPQGALTGVETGTYLTNARKQTAAGTNSAMTDSSDVKKGNYKTTDENTENSTGNSVRSVERNESTSGTANNTEDYVTHVFGKSAGVNYAKLVREFRDNLLNIDMKIINDLAELFMLIW